MLLRDLMWEIFQKTGRIEAYLIYRSCTEKWNEPFTAPLSDANRIIVPLC